MKKNIILSALLLPLFACSSDDSSENQNFPQERIGVFIDSPVINIGYKTATKIDITNSVGQFNYIAGESVTFFIGDLELPTVLATDIVTPLDIVGTQDTANPTVINIIRLLQTLDKDGDPSNGITITDTAKTTATQVDFSLDVSGFESSSAITNFLPNVTDLDAPVSTLISATDAINNFEQGLDDVFTIDVSQKTASSVITHSNCPGVPLGWNYTFTNTSLTLTGSDSWNEFDCSTFNLNESITINNLDTANQLDTPFACTSYPICTYDELDYMISGIDGDGRNTVLTSTFNRQTSTLTIVKQVPGRTFTEIITIR